MISVVYILSTGLSHLDSRLPLWWFPLGDFHLGDFALVISRSINSNDYPWKNVPPEFSYLHGNFHFLPPASWYLSIQLQKCFWVFNCKKFKYHGPLVHWWIPFDRCVGSFSEVNWGDFSPCYRLLLLSTRCAATPFGGSPPYYSHSELLIPKVFWWRREWHDTFVACPTTAILLLVVIPTTFYNPGLVGKQNHLGRFSPYLPHCHFIVVRALFCKRRCLARALHLPAPHHGSAPASFVPSRTPRVLEFPCWLELEPVIWKTGYLLPVDRFRSSLPGRFNLGCINSFASDWSCFDLEEFL